MQGTHAPVLGENIIGMELSINPITKVRVGVGDSSAMGQCRNSGSRGKPRVFDAGLTQDAATDAGSYLVLTLKVLEKSFVEICGDAVE